MARIKVSLFDRGCLAPLLSREIADVERRLRVMGHEMTSEVIGHTETYLRQLKGCLRAVELTIPTDRA